MHRRTLLSRSALCLFAATLAGCAVGAQTPSVISQQVIDDVRMVSTGVASLAPVLLIAGVVTLSQAKTVQNYVDTIAVAAALVVPGTAAVIAQPCIATIGSAFDGILKALDGVKLPKSVETMLAAVRLVLPVIQLSVGLSLVKPAAKDAAASLSTMTVVDARGALAKGLN